MPVHVYTDDVQRMCNEAVARLEDTEAALAETAEEILKVNKAKWASNWKTDADETIRKKGGGEQGVESGAMKRALTEKGAPGQVFEIDKNTLVLGISGKKPLPGPRGNAPAYAFEAGARYPRVGSKARSGFIRQPKRRLMRLTPAVQRDLLARLKARLLPDGK